MQFCIFLCHSTGQVATVLDIWVDGCFVFNKMLVIYCNTITEQVNESCYYLVTFFSSGPTTHMYIESELISYRCSTEKKLEPLSQWQSYYSDALQYNFMAPITFGWFVGTHPRFYFTESI